MTATDADLVERARTGDRDAFDLLVRRHIGTAFAVAISTLGEVADAEDAVQDAFIRALERLDDCRDPGKFGAWLTSIVRNRAHSLLRRRKVRLAAPLDEGRAAERGGRHDPVAETDRSLLREELTAALGELTEQQREVVLLHDLEGFRHREIAERLELPEGTVRSHLFHARRKLRARLGPVETEEESHERERS